MEATLVQEQQQVNRAKIFGYALGITLVVVIVAWKLIVRN